MKLWDKGYDLDKEVEKFTVGDDYLLDQKLLFWDCVASIAHAMMLEKIGILSQEELMNIKVAIIKIIELDKQGKFKICQDQEDCHTAIEEYLTEKLGETGKKIHTARSRNDQVLAALKLYMKAGLIEIEQLSLEFIEGLVEFAKKNNIAMPGYTHMQKAMPSTSALWAGSFAESMLDNLGLLKSAFEFLDTCPLGSAAGYGVSLDIDRQFVSDLLGFSKVQTNVIYVQNSRGKNEAVVLSALMNIMLDINKIAVDLILFSMQEFGYFELPKEYCTGSSIMPQKKNPDVLELLRAKSHVFQSLHQQVVGIIQSLPSGYNRDFQLTKKPLIEGMEIVKTSLKIITCVIKSLKVNNEKCEKAMTKELFATDMVYEYVKKGMPFRDAYKKVAKELMLENSKDSYYIHNSCNYNVLGLNCISGQIIRTNKYLKKLSYDFEKVIFFLMT
ncbi:argininosuccinate lyase [Candidatus Woesearchaeota archaeon]|nr:argininosuccinate lyase [Candidatus Woesearchaeota archaeon]